MIQRPRSPRSLSVTRVGLALLLVAPLQIWAQTQGAALPKPLTPAQEQAVLTFVDGAKPASSFWTDQHRRELAASEIRIAVLVTRCKLGKGFTALDPRHREASRRLVEQLDQAVKGAVVDEPPRLRARAVMATFALLSANQQRQVLAAMAGAEGAKALRLADAQRTLEWIPDEGVNVSTGAAREEIVVYLKQYFALAGLQRELREAVQTVRPEQLASFDRVDAIERHTPQDTAWLRSLSQDLISSAEPLSAALAKPWSKDLRQRVAVLRDFQDRVDAWLDLARAREKPEAAPFVDLIDRDYPQPAAYMAVANSGKFQQLGREVTAELCRPAP